MRAAFRTHEGLGAYVRRGRRRYPRPCIAGNVAERGRRAQALPAPRAPIIHTPRT